MPAPSAARFRRNVWRGLGTLRGQLIAGTLLFALLVILALNALALPRVRGTLEGEMQKGLRLIARSAASELDNDLGAVEEELLAIGGLVGDHPGGPGLDSTLVAAEAISPFIRALTVLDARGRIVARPSSPGRVGEDRSDREYFKAARPGTGVHLASVRTAVTGELSLHASTALPDGRTLMGSLALADRNPRLYRSVLELELPPGWRAWVTDPEGILLGHTPPAPAGWVPGKELSHLPTHFLDMGAGQARSALVEIDGERWVAAVARGPRFGWRVSVLQPALESDRAIRAALFPLSAIVVVILFALAGLATYTLSRMTTPLSALAGAMEAYGRGQVPVLAPRGVPELARVMTRFNEMVSDRENAEAQIQSTERRFERLFQESADAIYVGSASAGDSVGNRALLEMLRCTPADLASLDLAALFVNEQDRTNLGRALEAEGAARDFEVQLRRLNGETFWASATVTVFGDPSTGERTRLGIVRDISERKNLTQQLQEARRLEAVGRLAGGVAHDFNNLLTIVLGYADLMETTEENLPPAVVEAVEQIRGAAERGADLVRQLLAFGRRQVRRPVALDLGEVIRDLTPLLERLVPESISRRTFVPPEPVAVVADRTQLEQVVMNLVLNARDAMPDGGALTIEIGEVHVDPEVAARHAGLRPGRYGLLAVSDTGKGMSQETQDRVFEPFFTTKEMGRGTGLGLATVHGIVRQSGGHIWLYSEPGRGTEFKVYFPLGGDTQLQDAIESRADGATAGGTETILVVEDSAPIRALVEANLQRLGYVVHGFPDGEQAVAWARGEGAGCVLHLLLTDVVLPGMSGRDVADALVEDRPRLKILYVSGYTDNTIVHHGVLDAGIHFLEKPFSSAALAARVRHVLDTD